MKQDKHLRGLEILGQRVQLLEKNNKNNWEILSKNCPYRKKIKDKSDFKCTHKDIKKIEPLISMLFCRFCNCPYMREE